MKITKKQKENLLYIVIAYLRYAAVFTLSILALYITTQQVLRLEANTQIAMMVQDIASQDIMSQIQPGSTIDYSRSVDVSKIASPFVIIADNTMHIVESSISVKGSEPTLSSGVFEYAKMKGENRLTWQPMQGVREALIVKYVSSASGGWYAIAGQSLQETEKLIDIIGIDLLMGWVGGNIILFAVTYLTKQWMSKTVNKK